MLLVQTARGTEPIRQQMADGEKSICEACVTTDRRTKRARKSRPGGRRRREDWSANRSPADYDRRVGRARPRRGIWHGESWLGAAGSMPSPRDRSYGYRSRFDLPVHAEAYMTLCQRFSVQLFPLDFFRALNATESNQTAQSLAGFNIYDSHKT